MSSIDIRNMNLNLVPALSALLHERSVGRAAQRVGVSQSAMSHSLAKLRDMFDDPLLIPHGRTMVLSPRAEALARVLPPALEQLENALAGARPFDAAHADVVFRIATVDYFELTTLPSVMKYLARHAPKIRLRIERLSADSVSQLQQGRIDLILGGTGSKHPAGVRSMELYRDPFKVIARADHPSIGRRLSLDAYLDCDHVLVQFEGTGEGAVDRALARAGKQRRVGLWVPHFFSAPLAVATSDMLSTVASAVAQRGKELLGLKVLESPVTLAPAPVGMAWPRAHDADPARAWLRELISSGVAAPPAIRALMRQHN